MTNDDSLTTLPRASSFLTLYARCPRGLEAVLGDELRTLGAQRIQLTSGGVLCCGDWSVVMRANLMSRTASRILWQLAKAPYKNEKDIYRLAYQIAWPDYFSAAQSIKVSIDAVHAPLRSVHYVALVVKDALCDRFRQAGEARPQVDTRNPTMRIYVFLDAQTATVYLDTSGQPLFKRGWRQQSGTAPMRENLAAGCLLLAGYTGQQALIDPMCGSGTLLVEAADIALRRAPGRLRAFAFQQLNNVDLHTWERIRTEAKKQERTLDSLPIYGSDSSSTMVGIAHATLAHAGLRDALTVCQQDILNVRPQAPTGLIVTNPPYGIRLEERPALSTLYPLLGDWLKHYFAGWTAYFLTSDPQLAVSIRLTPKRRIPLYNGALECRLLAFPMVSGSARHKRGE